MKEILVTSSLDHTPQPCLFHAAKESKRPLLVGLHTWSHDRHNQISNMLPYAEKLDFHLLLPEFRGSNLKSNPNCEKACGSELAKQDIADAIEAVSEQYDIDQDNIFVLGLSGGGHMALLMAGYRPKLFKWVGAFVPICDLYQWTRENIGYSEHVVACCGSKEQMLMRSPIAYIDNIAQANVKIFHGKYDPVVPYTQSVEFYKALTLKYPDAKVFLDIFHGGHEIDLELAFYHIQKEYEGGRLVTVTG